MRSLTVLLMLLLASLASTARAQNIDELSKQLANPVASLISVPFQNNIDVGAGAEDDGFAYTLNIQPVIPFSISEDWNLISRTILPVAYRDYLPADDDFGLGDTTQSFFFSPKAPTDAGLIWGVGPAMLLPTGSNDYLGTGKWGIGPTAVGLIQKQHWTVGFLGNHIWSFAGDSDRPDVNQSFLQPFVSYDFGHGLSMTLNTESTYDWTGNQWTVPINLGVAQVLKIGAQPVSFQIGGRYYAEAPVGGPEWGMRSTITLLFPKK